MSADSNRRGSKFFGNIIRPVAANDKTVMESMVNFIQEVVPAYSHPKPKIEDKEKVVWCYFEETELDDICIAGKKGTTANSNTESVLLLVIGYMNGVQIYAVMPNGEAQDLLSLRQGPVKELKLLPSPKNVFEKADLYKTKRPLMALCDGASAGQPFCCVKIYSLLTGDEVKSLPHKSPINHIKCNSRVMAVVLHDCIAIYESCQFGIILRINSCYPCPILHSNPVALGTRWIAYADKKLVSVHQSQGGVAGDGGQSYTATVLNAAKSLQKGLTMFGDTVSSITGMKSSPVISSKNGNESPVMPGIVTIVDIQGAYQGNPVEVVVQEDSDGVGVVSHFAAHTGEAIVKMEFDPTGTLLVTADELGHNFHVFRILVHPFSSSLGAVHHLYTLYRGDTTAVVQGISFNIDSRWVAISTMRGTTHVFPISTYGGPLNMRTHCSTRVANRISRFHRSAGFDEMSNLMGASGRHSPVSTNQPSPSSSPGRRDHIRSSIYQNTIHNTTCNPRMPPYPHPCTVLPIVQIKQTFTIPGIGGSSVATSGPTPVKSQSASTSVRGIHNGGDVCVAACFAMSRGWVAGSPNLTRDSQEESKSVDSLFILNWMGQLVEHVLDPRPKYNLEKVSNDSPFEVLDTPKAQWPLGRSVSNAEITLPLSSSNLLICGYDESVKQRRASGEFQYGSSSTDMNESRYTEESLKNNDQWVSEVEINTHAPPHRRLWMGPQFSFKTIRNSQTTVVSSSASVLHITHDSPLDSHISTMSIVDENVDLQSLQLHGQRSSPMAMPEGNNRQRRNTSGSNDSSYNPQAMLVAGSFGSPSHQIDDYPRLPADVGPIQSEDGEAAIRLNLAEAMMESTMDVGVSRDGGPNSARQDISDPYRLDSSSTSSFGSTGSTSNENQNHAYVTYSNPPQIIDHDESPARGSY